MRLLTVPTCLAFILGLPLVAQEITISIPITVKANMRPVVLAWVNQCIKMSEPGVQPATCVQYIYPGDSQNQRALAFLRSVAQSAVRANLANVLRWAAANAPDTLPANLRAALQAKTTAENTEATTSAELVTVQ